MNIACTVSLLTLVNWIVISTPAALELPHNPLRYLVKLN